MRKTDDQWPFASLTLMRLIWFPLSSTLIALIRLTIFRNCIRVNIGTLRQRCGKLYVPTVRFAYFPIALSHLQIFYHDRLIVFFLVCTRKNLSVYTGKSAIYLKARFHSILLFPFNFNWVDSGNLCDNLLLDLRRECGWPNDNSMQFMVRNNAVVAAPTELVFFAVTTFDIYCEIRFPGNIDF